MTHTRRTFTKGIAAALIGSRAFAQSARGTILGVYATATNPLQQSIDAAGNVLQANGTSLVRMSPTGTTLNTYTTPYTSDAVVSDLSGNMWVTNQGNNSVTKLGPTGTVIGTFATGLQPDSMAIDQLGRIWVSNSGGSSCTVLNADGSFAFNAPTGAHGGPSQDGGPWNVVIDAYGNGWCGNYVDGTVSMTNRKGVLVYLVSLGATACGDVVIDSKGFIWACTSTTVYKISPNGVIVLTIPISLSYIGCLGIDGADNLWIGNSDATTQPVIVLNSAGTQIGSYTAPPHLGYICPDASGNMWMISYVNSTITKMATGYTTGPATPTVASLPAILPYPISTLQHSTVGGKVTIQ